MPGAKVKRKVEVSKEFILKPPPLDQLMEVQQENKVLIKKMLQIEAKPGNFCKETVTQKKIPLFSTSLNRVSRLRELTRVNGENQNFLKRLRNTQSTYDIKSLEKTSQEQLLLMENLCRNSSKASRTDVVDRYFRDNFFVRSPQIPFRADGFSTMGSRRIISAHSKYRLGTAGSQARNDSNAKRLL